MPSIRPGVDGDRVRRAGPAADHARGRSGNLPPRARRWSTWLIWRSSLVASVSAGSDPGARDQPPSVESIESVPWDPEACQPSGEPRRTGARLTRPGRPFLHRAERFAPAERQSAERRARRPAPVSRWWITQARPPSSTPQNDFCGRPGCPVAPGLPVKPAVHGPLFSRPSPAAPILPRSGQATAAPGTKTWRGCRNLPRLAGARAPPNRAGFFVPLRATRHPTVSARSRSPSPRSRGSTLRFTGCPSPHVPPASLGGHLSRWSLGTVVHDQRRPASHGPADLLRRDHDLVPWHPVKPGRGRRTSRPCGSSLTEG